MPDSSYTMFEARRGMYTGYSTTLAIRDLLFDDQSKAAFREPSQYLEKPSESRVSNNPHPLPLWKKDQISSQSAEKKNVLTSGD